MIEAQLTATEPPIDSRYYLAPAAGAGWLAGIWLGSTVDLPALVWLMLSVPLIIGAVVLWRRGRVGLVLAACVALALGGARYVAAQPPLDPGQIHYYNGAKSIVALGEVAAEPALTDTRAQLRIAVQELIVDGQPRPVTGALLIDVGRFPAVAYGSTVRVSGDVSSPEATSTAGYAAYLERRGIRSVMRFPRVEVVGEGGGSPLTRTLLNIKERGREVINTALPEPHAALLTGILLGDDSGMPRSLSDAFRATGMTHIIAISGFNIALIIALLDQVSAPLLPRRAAAVLIMLLVAFYAVLVGASASVVRAAVMGMAYLASLRLMGRPTLAVAGLFSAAFLMTLAQPQALWDVGFQLSFAATLGLMIYAGPWTRRLDRGASTVLAPEARRKVVSFLADITVVTLAAQLLTLPLILFHFGRLSLASLPANMLLLPAQPGVMVAGGVTLLLGLLLPFAGQMAGWIAWPFLNYTIQIVYLLAGLPGASVPLSLSAPALVAVYGLIAAVTLLATVGTAGRRMLSERLPVGRKGVVVLAGAALAALLLVAWFIERPDGRLRVAFLDVGQGDAIFIQTPAGRQLLIDGGRYPSVVLEQLGRQMPFWDRSIDLVIATHPDADHVVGLVSVLERYQVSQLITNGADAESDPAFAALLAAAEEQNVVVHPAQTGETILPDEGVRLEILHTGSVGAADNRNDASIVSLLTYGELSALLTGDSEAAAEATLLQSGRSLNTVILKAGHHGANTSSGESFLQAVSPQVIVISAGRDNSYGHPHPSMLARAAAVGATVLRTDQMGTVEVVSDGRRMWWEVERDVTEGGLP